MSVANKETPCAKCGCPWVIKGGYWRGYCMDCCYEIPNVLSMPVVINSKNEEEHYILLILPIDKYIVVQCITGECESCKRKCEDPYICQDMGVCVLCVLFRSGG